MIIANQQLFENLYAKDQRIQEASWNGNNVTKAKLEEGLEELSNNKIKYNTIDARRRIVKFYRYELF